MTADASGAGTAPADPGTGEGGEEVVTQPTEGAPEGDQQEGGDDAAAQLAHWKEMARKHEKRARENAAAAARMKQIDQANMTEIEKAQAAQRDAERERDDAIAGHTRMLAAAANNLPVELIDHLGTGTEEEINERAELFASVIESMATEVAEQMIADKIAAGELVAANGSGRNGQPQGPGARPVESLRAGSAPAGTAPDNPEQWFRQLLNGPQ